MKKVNVVLRILCGLIDAILVMLPIQFIMMAIFHVSLRQADFLLQTLFAVYGVLLIEYMEGGSLGKFFGKLKVVDGDGGKPPTLYVGLRELTKALYFIPYVGWTFAIVSAAIAAFGDGRAIHDYVGGTRVVYVWEEGKMEGLERQGEEDVV